MTTVEHTDAGSTANTFRDYSPYRVSVEEYISFRSQGFLIVRDLVDQTDVKELLNHTDDILYGRVTAPGLEPPPPGATKEEIEKRYLRIHMLHRVLPIHEKYLLHPRVLDVVQALMGPDVLALQTMLFFKPPGGVGQG
ncbi:MAG TPA: phytanoyl-CoA dioxygenase family protein, partial [Anaerolineae bacterium]